MKTLLILILLGALCGGAFLSKPREDEFRKMVHAKLDGQKVGLLQRIFKGPPAEEYLKGCKFTDRGLWVDVERGGKTVYTGAFSSWFGDDFKIEPAR